MIVQTGTAQYFDCTDTTEGQESVSITVPDDCDCIVACWAACVCYTDASPGANVFSIGANDFDNVVMYGRLGGSGENDISNQLALEVLVAPPTGSQTLTWDWGVAELYMSRGGVVLVTYYKGVDQTNPVYDSTYNTTAEDLSGMSYGFDTIMLGVCVQWGSGEATATQFIQVQDVKRKTAFSTSGSSAAFGHKLNTSSFAGNCPDSNEHSAAIQLSMSTETPDAIENCDPFPAQNEFRPTVGVQEQTYYRNMRVGADVDCIVVAMVANWTKGSLEWYRDSNPFFTLGDDSTPFEKAAFIMDPDTSYGQVIIIEVFTAPPDVGQYVELQWDTTEIQTVYPTEGTVIVWSTWKGVDPDDPIRDWGASEDSSSDITGLDSGTGDCMVGVAMNNGSNPSINFNSQIQLCYQVAIGATDDNWINWGYKYEEDGFYWSDGGQGAGVAIILRKYIEDAFIYGDASVGLGLSDGMGSLEVEIGAVGGTLGFTEEGDQDLSLERGTSPGFGFNAVVFGETDAGIGRVILGLTEIAEAFNLSNYLRAYGPVLVYSYQVILTGAADGLPDYVLTGVKSVAIRLRQGEPSYLQAVMVYDDAALDALLARPNGDVVAYMIASANGVEILREALLNAAYDSTRFDRGGDSQSITLVGYRTQSFGGAAVPVPLAEVTTESMAATGLMRYRCARPDFYLKPGDTATYGSVSFEVNMISYNIAPGSVYMDVSE